MSDTGNIDIASKLGKPKPIAANEKKELKSEPIATKKNSKADFVKQENKSVYKEPASSQESFKSSNSDSKTEIKGENKSYKFSANNPILESKLSNRQKFQIENKKNKKAPPQPSLRVRLSPKGVAINPRKVKPHMPGRLKSFFDDRIKMIDKLEEAISIDKLELNQLNLLNEFSKNLLASKREFLNNSSLAELLDINIDIADLTKDKLVLLLKDKSKLLAEDIDLQEYLNNIVLQIQQNNQLLSSLLQLFMPLPLPFLFVEIDEEFENDEEELYGDDDENFLSSGEEDSEEDDEVYDSEASLSIKTMNFNKILFIIKYSRKLNKLKLGIKGDASATELAIPIETNLEEAIEDDVDNIDYLLRLWNDRVLRVTESRILKVRSKGNLSPIILKACNSILNTISESDINLDDDDTISASYNMI